MIKRIVVRPGWQALRIRASDPDGERLFDISCKISALLNLPLFLSEGEISMLEMGNYYRLMARLVDEFEEIKARRQAQGLAQ